MNLQKTISENILSLRKNKNITQEMLAEKLGVTFQSVSKWENGVCFPDIELIPQIAEIFNVTTDYIFGIESNTSLPWSDDSKLRAVAFVGRKMVSNAIESQSFIFEYNGKALNVESLVSIKCETIEGNASAACDIQCETIKGNATAGCDIQCETIKGNATAGCDVKCETIGGNISAGGEIN